MDTIRINLDTPVIGVRELHPISMFEANGEFLIYFNGTKEGEEGYKECYGISDGQTLLLRRTIEGEYGTIIEAKLKVKKEDTENHVVYTNVPYFPPMRISRYEKFEYNGKTAYRLIMSSPHNVFAQDCVIGNTRKLILRDASNNELGRYNFCVAMDIEQRPATINDYVYVNETVEPCGQDFEKEIQWKYDYITSGISQNSLMLTEEPTDDILEKMCFAEVENSNPIFHIEELNNVYDKSGNHVKEYFFLNNDYWLKDIKKEYDRGITENCSLKKKETLSIGAISSINLLQDCSYWDVALGLSVDENTNGLGSEDTFGENLVNELKESSVPDFVDMERIKYVPSNQNGTEIATAITFNFHFLQRVFASGNNTTLTSAYTYADGWYIDTDNKPSTWWNGMANKSSSFYEKEMKNFYEASGSTSDLLGYLNFLDTDVYYRKKKLSKTFLRLKFFTSNDPMTQKLLFSSTIFMDANRLYGDYLKAKDYLEDKSAYFIRENSKIIWNSANTMTVFFDNPSEINRLDSHMTVTNEYDTTRSAEGYNLYLFSDDADMVDSEETDYRTIYMKAEFNHAGNGKTIPMILWPKNGDTFEELTTTNLAENLYIPVHVKYSSKLKRYVYSVPKATYSGETLVFNLFEPKVNPTEYSTFPYLEVDKSACTFNFGAHSSVYVNETEGNHKGGFIIKVSDDNSAFTFTYTDTASTDEPFRLTATTNYYNCTSSAFSASVSVSPISDGGATGSAIIINFVQKTGNTIQFLSTDSGEATAKALKVDNKHLYGGASSWLSSEYDEILKIQSVYSKSANTEYKKRTSVLMITNPIHFIFVTQASAEQASTSS